MDCIDETEESIISVNEENEDVSYEIVYQQDYKRTSWTQVQ